MILGLNTVKTAIRGTADMELIDQKLWLHRFTAAQREAYRTYSLDFLKKAKATAGVRLEFATDSTTLRLTGECYAASSRQFFGFDVYVNGSLVCHQLNTLGEEGSAYMLEAQLGSAKTKNVVVYFPWSVQANIGSLSLDDDAVFEPIYRSYKMICFGDSITHGYDAKNPSFSYANRLADALCADHINKGIGAEVFYPTLAALKDDYDPDYITVAYGTNDWSHSKKEDFDKDSVLFFENLAKSYPRAKIFALTPVWRRNCETRETEVGKFLYVTETLEKIADAIPGVECIDCIDCIPHDPQYYVADVLHPNDAGFYHYAAGLYAEIKKRI